MSYYEQLRREDARRRKRTGAITVGVGLGLVAGLITVANALEEDVDEVTAVCVTADPAADGSYQVVDEDYCGSHGAYVYYYGGSTSGGYVRGGSTTRPPNAQIVTRSGKVLQRGGFGGRGTSGG